MDFNSNTFISYLGKKPIEPSRMQKKMFKSFAKHFAPRPRGPSGSPSPSPIITTTLDTTPPPIEILLAQRPTLTHHSSLLPYPPIKPINDASIEPFYPSWGISVMNFVLNKSIAIKLGKGC